MFKLKRPCQNCPFRKGQGEKFRLGADRLAEIFEAPAFQCHKTIDYDAEDEEGYGRAGDTPQQCAGLMAVLHRAGRPNQIMQVASRITPFDPAGLDPDGEAYDTIADVQRAHCGRERRKA